MTDEILLQFPVALALVALATYISERERSIVDQRNMLWWHWWHAALPNSQWAFGSFYVAIFWTVNSPGIRVFLFVMFITLIIIFGVATRFTAEIFKSTNPQFGGTWYEKWNNGLFLASVVTLVIFVLYVRMRGK